MNGVTEQVGVPVAASQGLLTTNNYMNNIIQLGALDYKVKTICLFLQEKKKCKLLQACKFI